VHFAEWEYLVVAVAAAVVAGLQEARCLGLGERRSWWALLGNSLGARCRGGVAWQTLERSRPEIQGTRNSV
jgi:hypothetical protein